MLKYLEVNWEDVCNLLSNCSERKKTMFLGKKGGEDREGKRENKCGKMLKIMVKSTVQECYVNYLVTFL